MLVGITEPRRQIRIGRLDPANDEFCRHQRTVFFVGVDEIAGIRIRQDGIAFFVVQIVVKFIACCEQIQDRTIRLGEVLGNVFQEGGFCRQTREEETKDDKQLQTSVHQGDKHITTPTFNH